MESKATYRIKKYRDGDFIEVDDWVVVEYALQIFLNGVDLVTILCTPKSLEELVVGHLFSEGILESLDDLIEVVIDEQKGQARVTTVDRDIYQHTGENLGKRQVINSAAGGLKTLEWQDPGHWQDGPFDFHQGLALDTKNIYRLVELFSDQSQVFQQTGGVHGCALCDSNEIIFFEEDIGRHNALDKILGRALISGIDLNGKFIISSGRVAEGMIRKLLRARIQVLVSRSAPTNAAIDAARALGVTLLGFVRGQRMNLYSSHE